jgi:hypothetical protein
MRMKTAPFLALLFLIDGVFLVSGCSVLVTSGGISEREFFHQDATRETIQRQLGNPILTQPFKAPKRIDEVPELEPIAMRLRSHGGMLVAFREDFHYRGWLLEPESHGAYLFFFIMTAGLSEIIFFLSQSLRERRVLSSHILFRYGSHPRDIMFTIAALMKLKTSRNRVSPYRLG